jgi:hypothetical protein
VQQRRGMGAHPAPCSRRVPTPRPVERLISSYEFAVDVAAKGVLHQARPRKNPKRRADFVGTLEVWPWSILVPWFKQDMAQRVRGRCSARACLPALRGASAAHTRGPAPRCAPAAAVPPPRLPCQLCGVPC